MKKFKKIIAAMLIVSLFVGIFVSGTVSAELVPDSEKQETLGEQPYITADIRRLSGMNRIETANAIAAAGWESADSVVIASGESYADALAGVPFAYAVDAPILLVMGGELAETTLKVINDLGAKQAYILGGIYAVSERVEQQLTDAGCEIDRIWGETRFDTCLETAERLADITGEPSEVFVTSGLNFADALSAGSAAAIMNSPILYAIGGEIPEGILSFVSESDVGTAYIMGGVYAVGDEAKSSLEKNGVETVERLGGETRFDTALVLAKRFDNIFSNGNVSFATGLSFPDALAGGVYAAKKAVPILFMDNKTVFETYREYIRERDPAVAYAFGGEYVVSNEIMIKHLEKETYVNLTINESDFTSKKNTLTLSGTCGAFPEVSSVSYIQTSYSDGGEPSAYGNAELNGDNWETSVKLKPGSNTFVFTGENAAGKTESKKITVTYDPGTVYTPETAAIVTDEATGTKYVNNIMLVYLESGAPETRAEEIAQQLGGTVAGAVYALDMYQIRIPEKTLSELETLSDEISNNCQGVIYATYDSAEWTGDAAYAPNDPWGGYASESDWKDTDIDGDNWWAEAINAQYGWDYSSRMDELKVGVCDFGFYAQHSELKNMYNFPSPVLAARNSTAAYTRDKAHGTAVAAIIAAEPNNKVGLTGVSFGKAKLLPAAANGTDSCMYANLAYMVEAGAKIVNYSVGIGWTQDRYDSVNGLALDKFVARHGDLAAVSTAKLLEKYDFLVVQSAGNGIVDESGAPAGDGIDALYNGGWCCVTSSSTTASGTVTAQDVIDHTIIVSSVGLPDKENKYTASAFANGGSAVDIAAPGEQIYTADSSSSTAFSRQSGTSCSAAMVSGTASLVWSVNAGFDAAGVKKLVCGAASVKAADNKDSQKTSGEFGLLDVRAAVEAAVGKTDAAGTLTGRIVDAGSGEAVKGASIECLSYNGFAAVTPETVKGTSADDGTFSMKLFAGTYTFRITDGEYIGKVITVSISADETTALGDIAIVTEIDKGNIRAQLTWGHRIRDLDLHFVGKLAESGEQMHVYYYVKGDPETAQLVQEDANYEGPESVNIDLNKFSEFTLYVLNYSNYSCTPGSPEAGNLSLSGAMVEIYSGDVLLASYSVPSGKSGNLWKVATMKNDGSLTEVGTFSFENSSASVGLYD